MVSRRRAYRKAQCRESKSAEHSSSASKGAPKTISEPGTQTPSESVDECTQFHRSADQAATASQKAKTPSKKGGGNRAGQGCPKDSKSSATSVTKPGSGKGSKRTGKEASLAEKPHWDHSYKIPKRPAPDTSVSSEAQTPRKTDKHKRPKKKAAKIVSSTSHKKGLNPEVKTEGGPPTSKSSPLSDLPLDYWANHRPGDGVIPANAERVQWEGGLVLFQGTRHHPLIAFEAQQETQRQAGHQLRLWRLELINYECQSLDASQTVRALVSPRTSDLPRLPPWAAPNRWDYWGRLWAYVDAQSGHSEVGVTITLTPPSTRVTVAVLVECPHETQFLPDIGHCSVGIHSSRKGHASIVAFHPEG